MPYAAQAIPSLSTTCSTEHRVHRTLVVAPFASPRTRADSSAWRLRCHRVVRQAAIQVYGSSNIERTL